MSNITDEEWIYRFSLPLIPNVGDSIARNLVSYCGAVKEIFTEKKSVLKKIPGIGARTAESIATFNDFERARKEWEFVVRNKITPLFYLDENYPFRLKNFSDSPVLMFYKGKANLNNEKVIAVVGTRNATSYGKDFCENLCEELSGVGCLLVSGLAFGIDTAAHKNAVKNGIDTIGVLGHGLQTIFPAENRNLAKQMATGKGGLLTEYRSDDMVVKENFPKRNRIVAGMCDALLIVESGIKGGAIITAEIANNYNRDVYALPGGINAPFSLGCNKLISNHKAQLVENASGFVKQLGWQKTIRKKKTQPELPLYLTDDEKRVLQYLSGGERAIDDIYLSTGLNVSQLAFMLLDLEFKGLVKVLPGKTYTRK